MLENARLQLKNPLCNPSAETVNAIVKFDDDLTDLLPYLNAELGPGMYDRNVPFLRLLLDGRVVTIHPRQIAISKLRDEAEAREVADQIKSLINDIAARRDRITPRFDGIGRFTAMDAFKLLPKTNCSRCGRPTCLAFAAALTAGEAAIQDCPPLESARYDTQRAALMRLLGPTG